MLSDMFQKKAIPSIICDGDADGTIVQTAVACAATNPTTVIGEDTDLLVLLCFHVSPASRRIYFRSDIRSNKKKRVWDIKQVQQALGQQMCRFLLFSHAITGCDTTSRMFGVGKNVPLKKLKRSNSLSHAAEVFLDEAATVEDVVSAGEKAIVCLYNGSSDDTLDSLRHAKFCERAAKSPTSVKVHKLPPTSAAARYHSMRAYLQVQQWKQPTCPLDPLSWGWSLVQGRLAPIQVDLPPAPETLLQVIRCNCKTDCSSNRCTCRKHGLQCSTACGNCRGIVCSNAPIVSLEEVLKED